MLTSKRIHGKLFVAQWIRFSDNFGSGWAQPDLFLVVESSIVLIECKLTQTPVAFLQMRELYAPLLRTLYPGKDVACIQACKNLLTIPEKLLTSFAPVDGATWLWV